MITLPYKELSDIFLLAEENITDANLNKILGKFIANDSVLSCTSDDFPGLWECRWYNNSSIKGYSRGDAVWLNTEDMTSFIMNNSDKIYDYASKNPYLKDKIKKFQANVPSIYFLYKKIVSGYDLDGISLPPLFVLGNITSMAQIRVSLSDDNKALPTDDSAWKDFFINNQFELLSNDLCSIMDEALSIHLSTYHIGVDKDDSSEISSILSTYLKNDFSNAKYLQIASDSSNLNTTGFDFIKEFAEIKLDDNCVRWFRLWNSGILEHGGIALADEDARIYEVRLDWTYGNNLTAKIYEYPIDSESFYGIYNSFDTGDAIDTSKLLNENHRYSIELTPIKDSIFLSDAYSDEVDDYSNHIINEACMLKNDSFSVKLNSSSAR